jgi:hypothetical protein
MVFAHPVESVFLNLKRVEKYGKGVPGGPDIVLFRDSKVGVPLTQLPGVRAAKNCAVFVPPNAKPAPIRINITMKILIVKEKLFTLIALRLVAMLIRASSDI